MPTFQHSLVLSAQADEVFRFLAQPANFVRVMPPDFELSLIEGPPELSLGARMVFLSKRWGFSQRILNEVTVFEPNRLIVDIQREGPFEKWEHRHQVEPTPGGTRMTDEIDFEPPGGLIGMLLSEKTILKELEEVFAYRDQQFRELLK
jgi:ligand-binding SRPBCC domain-containing protein